MKGNELRIGNFVQDYSGNFRRITGYDLYVYETNNNTWYAQTKPIPLTEKWIERFCFVKCDHYYKDTKLWTIQLWFREDRGYYIGYRETGVMVGCFLNFVHELQNLYFALTGEELQ